MTEDRRHFPRIQVDAEDEWIRTGPEYAILDVSVDGLGLRSSHPLKPGEKLTVILEGGTEAEVEVTACNMTEPPDEYADGEFRIGCKFTSKLAAKAILRHVEN